MAVMRDMVWTRRAGTAPLGPAVLTALALLAGCAQEAVRYFAPHGRFPVSGWDAPPLTEESPLALLEAGYANIGEMSLVGLQEDGLEVFLDNLLEQARIAGAAQIRLEDVVDFEGEGYVEGQGHCTYEVERESSYTLSRLEFSSRGTYVVDTTYTTVSTECAAHADVYGLVAKRLVRATLWRREPELAGAQLTIALDGGGETVEVTADHRFDVERRWCLAGRAESCERAAQMATSVREAQNYNEHAVYLYGLWCDQGVPASCRAVERLTNDAGGRS
jgi:hypothetical protein